MFYMSLVSGSSCTGVDKFVYSDNKKLNELVSVGEGINLDEVYVLREKARVLASSNFFAELPVIVDAFAAFVFTEITSSVGCSLGYSRRLPTRSQPLIREYSLNIRKINTIFIEIVNDESLCSKENSLRKWLEVVNNYKEQGPQDSIFSDIGKSKGKIKLTDTVEPNYAEFNAHLAKIGEATVKKLNGVFENFRSREGNDGFHYDVKFTATGEQYLSTSVDVSTGSRYISSPAVCTDDLGDLWENMLEVTAYYQPTEKAVEQSSSQSKKPSYE